MNRSRETQLHTALEALHFGFRAITARPDEILDQIGLARVHHRILYFVARNPEQAINELLATMQVSKQYLNRPLRKLLDEGYVATVQDEQDKRIKRLRLTPQGEELEQQLTGVQRQKLQQIFKASGKDKEQVWLEVMQSFAE